ncbi:MAG: 2-oxoacid:acceptor oxidoreductase family protein [Anaerovoracaceae bacterium]
MVKKILIAGFGGQGIISMGQMLAYAAMKEGKNVTFMPSYGPEMRGGTANCTVVISDDEIASPIVTELDVLLAMNASSLEKFQGELVAGGTIIINSGLVSSKVDREDITPIYVDCLKIAGELGNEKVSNVVMLGKLVSASGIIEMEVAEEVLKDTFSGSKAKLLPLNIKALNYV